MGSLEALRVAILFAGWPGMALVTAFVLWQATQFQRKVQGSPFGRLVLLMVVGWTTSIGFLAFLATLYLQNDPAGAGPMAAAFLSFWAASMSLVVYLMHRWGAEAVHINLYYTELAAMDQVKTQLINTVAHELNTPLTPITLKLALLKDGRFGPLTSEQGQVLDSMDRNLVKLSTLVDQIVLSTQIQTGQLRPIPVPTEVADWLHTAADRFAAQAEQERRPFAVHVDTDATVGMDRSRMDRVLNALLDNAFRFSGKGDPVEITATTAGGKLVVQVRDGGMGFTPEQAELLFQPMRQPHDAHSHTQVGAGLSLFVAKGIVEAHGGHMWASSPGPGRGATFRLEIPLGAAVRAWAPLEVPAAYVPAR
ncbi:MAG TPA: HAMP domain-containing sensor histidine kinase [Candidatus Thermoplasmatota archaeon]|nr:HAMP domain-containing sensor histidine kinase [Candidatus Thermoplasmatota archaeon]